MLRYDHPLWSCGMRPFFLLAGMSASALMALWTGALALGWPVPAVAGGALVWHVHELLFGFGLAAVAGFALTAVPEFTGTPGVAPGAVRALVACWLIGRLGFAFSGLPGIVGRAGLVLSALAHGGLLLGLVATLGPRLWRQPGRPQLAFLWALLALLVLAAGCHFDLWRGADAMRWLRAALGVLMVLIVVAMSRISMRIVNRAIDAARLADEPTARARGPYVARPPRRRLAVLCIAAFTASEFFAPGSRPAGWLALAASAALCSLQTDWHIGRPLLRRWPLLLFLVYVLMALGYALVGIGLLQTDGAAPSATAGRHLLTVGALGLNVLVVICIAGRSHVGRLLDERLWVILAGVLVLVSALLRALGAWHGAAWLHAAGLCWLGAWALLLWRMGPLLWQAREDGGAACDGPRQPVSPASSTAC